jgi:hypothetical protein
MGRSVPLHRCRDARGNPGRSPHPWRHMGKGRGFIANFLRQTYPCPGRDCLERENDHKCRTIGRDEPITSIVQVPLKARSSIYEDGAPQQNASPHAPFFSKNYSKFRAIFASLVLPCRPRPRPACHASHGMEITHSTHSRGRCPTLLTTCVDWRQNLWVS